MTTPVIPTDAFTRRLQKIANLIQQGQLQEAALELNAAVKIVPTDPRVFLQGARLAEAAGNPQKAEESARRAVAMNPMWIVSVTELAALLARLNKFKEAMEQAQKAVSLAPDNVDVLSRAIDIAHRAQALELALQWLRRLDGLTPGNSQIRGLMARDLRALGRHGEALEVYASIMVDQPSNGDAVLGHAQVAWMLGDRATALGDCERLIAADPGNEILQFWHGLAKGDTPATLPLSMVRDMHDTQADTYNLHMTQGMQYRLPRQMAGLIRSWHPDVSFHMLDLGCGTGLLAAELGPKQGALVGVEISTRMVEQAARLNQYQRFHTVNLLDALAETPEGLYHVISACDVFGYVGDLSRAIPDAFKVLAPGGHLVFSCEAARQEEGDLALRTNLRFVHGRDAVEALCKAAGFDEVELTDTVLYVENNQPVNGFIVAARKPA